LRHSTRNTKQTKVTRSCFKFLKHNSKTNRHGKLLTIRLGGGGNKNSSAIFLTKNRQFINNEEHHSKIFIQKYLYNRVKIELHYSIARITRHVKFKARHVLILQKRRKTRTTVFDKKTTNNAHCFLLFNFV